MAWYDSHRRDLPWRAPPGVTPDPYHVWLSEIMLQQTVVAAVKSYFLKFTVKWPTVFDLAAAPSEEVMELWAGLGYYARARNLHKCAKVLSERGGVFPCDETELKALPGIGDYTSAAIAAIAWNRPATVVDGNVERVIARYFMIEQPLPAGKRDMRHYARALSEGRTDRPGDFAQGMMDLGATICTPRSPRCALCPVRDGCLAYAAGMAEELPRRGTKKTKPRKFGYIYWIRDENNRVLFERRPENGILGGTTGLPTSSWDEDRKPIHLTWLSGLENSDTIIPADLRIFHSFTHFDLELEGRLMNVKSQHFIPPAGFFWLEADAVNRIGIPSVFKKFVNLMKEPA